MSLISSQEYDELWVQVCKYISQHCVVRDRSTPSKTPGHVNSWIFNLRPAWYNPLVITQLSKMFVYHYERSNPNFDFQIAGIETGSMALATAVPMVAADLGVQINAFVVRKSRKTYGLCNILDGTPNHLPVVLMEDVCNSGQSMGRAAATVIEEGLELANTGFAVAHMPQNFNPTYFPSQANFRLVSLFSHKTFGLPD